MLTFSPWNLAGGGGYLKSKCSGAHSSPNLINNKCLPGLPQLKRWKRTVMAAAAKSLSKLKPQEEEARSAALVGQTLGLRKTGAFPGARPNGASAAGCANHHERCVFGGRNGCLRKASSLLFAYRISALVEVQTGRTENFCLHNFEFFRSTAFVLSLSCKHGSILPVWLGPSYDRNFCIVNSKSPICSWSQIGETSRKKEITEVSNLNASSVCVVLLVSSYHAQSKLPEGLGIWLLKRSVTGRKAVQLAVRNVTGATIAPGYAAFTVLAVWLGGT